MNTTATLFLRWIYRLMAVLGVAGAFIAVGISNWQVVNAPLLPNFDTGETNIFFVRGVYIYLDDMDLLIEIYLFKVMVIMGVLGAGLLNRLESKHPKGVA